MVYSRTTARPRQRAAIFVMMLQTALVGCCLSCSATAGQLNLRKPCEALATRSVDRIIGVHWARVPASGGCTFVAPAGTRLQFVEFAPAQRVADFASTITRVTRVDRALGLDDVSASVPALGSTAVSIESRAVTSGLGRDRTSVFWRQDGEVLEVTVNTLGVVQPLADAARTVYARR